MAKISMFFRLALQVISWKNLLLFLFALVAAVWLAYSVAILMHRAEQMKYLQGEMSDAR